MTIRSLFSAKKRIERTIEKVIDYSAHDEERLANEIEEYEITDNVEECFRKLLENLDYGIRGGHVIENGVWVSGFYGSGKSSFTKYLGFSLDTSRKVRSTKFADLLNDRFRSPQVPALLNSIISRHPIGVVLLDLGSEQLAESAVAPVSTVLYWKVLQWAGYSKDKKLAQLEFTLDRYNKLDEFKILYSEMYKNNWDDIHNDPLLGNARAAMVIPRILPEEFPTPESFRNLRFEMGENLKDRVSEMIDLCRKKTGYENILFIIDEAGQYVARRSDLILNMDGMARNLKEQGKGKVWIIATGQQTLTEIVERATHNSAELNKLRDRFPISIHLDARDIKEITYRRLLTKSTDGQNKLKQLFNENGQSLIVHTRLDGTSLYKNDPDAEIFSRFYPFLPQHFELLLELIRKLARSTGGIGLRSVIRVIQDVLVDKSRVLSRDITKLADREVGYLACVDDFYDTLRADIARDLPHVVNIVDKIVSSIYKDDLTIQRVAKAIATLQSVENFPRTAENIAALLYPRVGNPSLLNEVRDALTKLIENKECNLIEDPQSGGYVFLSEGVRPLRNKRSSYIPSGGECNRVRNEILQNILETQPSARLENIKEVKASVQVDKSIILGDKEDINIKIQFTDYCNWEKSRLELLTQTSNQSELKNYIIWLCHNSEIINDLIPEVVRSEKIVNEIDERNVDKDVAQFIRSEIRSSERNRDSIQKVYESILSEGVMIFRGKPIPVEESGQTIDAAVRNIIGIAAKEIFSNFHLAPIRPSTELASKFLLVDRLDRIPKELDPLNFVVKKSGSPRINLENPAIAEVLRIFITKVDESGSGRLSGSYIQDIFSSYPYGWSKDTTRYIFAALLVAGQIEVHTADGTLKTSGPQSAEAFKSSISFNRIGISKRDSKISPDTLDRAAKRLEDMFGEQVLPLEDHISKAVRRCMPDILERSGALPDRLRLLGLVGEERARNLLSNITDLLKGDASNAAAGLGGTTCQILEDINWAKKSVETLNTGAESELKYAQATQKNIVELQSLFVSETSDLISQDEFEIINQVFLSENFFEKLPDLRGVIRAVTDRTVELYINVFTSFKDEIKRASQELESVDEWLLVSDEDREELSKKLDFNIQSSPNKDNPLIDLRMLLTTQATLLRHLELIKDELRKRKPIEIEDFGGYSNDYDDDSVDEDGDNQYGEVDVVYLNEFIPSQTITNYEQLECWLDSIRIKMEQLLRNKRCIRVEEKDEL
ncbi:BREX system P-loop protein BrxC [Desnuesiella massiliensis]|uniref:BREX system P-loop protein BrxC n=1 Tax=Desnuesiella massiliensis TaxID=1650662 RepID=UPI0006E42ACD|nr:BREX system P-loop protein BrxC [Desnuesiella massiliensis]